MSCENLKEADVKYIDSKYTKLKEENSPKYKSMLNLILLFFSSSIAAPGPSIKMLSVESLYH